ncbi:MAG: hypothetical protein K2X03_00335 [Bryobacteraceae bacterium]|nr:hypothetical protein [Bryobacteraceae bacterium]
MRSWLQTIMTLIRLTLLLLLGLLARAQVITFETNGLNYQTLTKGGLTIMFAQLPMHTKDYAVLQVAVSNGAKTSWNVKPEDFTFRPTETEPLKPEAPRIVVNRLIDRGGRDDAIRLMTTYEAGLYGLSRIKSTSGYEQRRQQMLAELTSAKIKAAAAASAIAFVGTKLKPGESTDGAVFFATGGKPLPAGKLTVNAGGEFFEFLAIEPLKSNSMEPVKKKHGEPN